MFGFLDGVYGRYAMCLHPGSHLGYPLDSLLITL